MQPFTSEIYIPYIHYIYIPCIQRLMEDEPDRTIDLARATCERRVIEP